MASSPRPPDERVAPPAAIETAELRAKVAREFRRGLTMKSIAGGLGISVQRVSRILEEDQKFIQNLSPKSYDIILGQPTGNTEQEQHQRDLKEKLKAEQRERHEQLIRQREEHFDNTHEDDVGEEPPVPVPPISSPPKPKNQNQNQTQTQITVYSPRKDQNYYAQKHHAFQLRKEGKTYYEIADAIGSTPQEAQRMVKAELSTLSLDEYSDRELARRMQLERLDALMVAVWPAATRGPTEDFPDQEPNLEASRTALRILERQAKLLGLDSPAKIDISDRIRIIAERNGVDYEDMMQYVQESTKLKLAPTS